MALRERPGAAGMICEGPRTSKYGRLEVGTNGLTVGLRPVVEDWAQEKSINTVDLIRRREAYFLRYRLLRHNDTLSRLLLQVPNRRPFDDDIIRNLLNVVHHYTRHLRVLAAFHDRVLVVSHSIRMALLFNVSCNKQCDCWNETSDGRLAEKE